MRKTRPLTCALALSLLLTMLSSSAWAATPNTQPAAKTPIKHLVVLMQENHSFDNYFGTYPGADGIPADVCMPVDPLKTDSTECVRPFHIGDNEVQLFDPDHSDATHRLQFNEGHMDGFVSALNKRNQDGRLAMGYYDDRDLPYYWNLADEYVLFDQFFSSAAGGSLINHVFWVTADADENASRMTGTSLDRFTTVFDRLEERGISWKFYVQNYEPRLTYRTLHEFPGNRAAQVVWCPLLNFDRFIDDPKLSSHIVHIDEYYKDLENGTLPAVAYMVPSGPSEHPPSSIQAGQKFTRSLIQALMQREAWYSSAFLVVYDDWGGWYDHVPPPQVDQFGYGFRVPGFLISPYAKRGHIDHTVLDYTSIIKFIFDNYGIEPLAERDAKANSFISALDFNQAPREPRFTPFDRLTEEKRPEPRRSVIFIAYGLALIVTMLLIAFAAWRTRRSSKPVPPDVPQSKENSP